MFQKRIIKVFCIFPLGILVQSCCVPGVATSGGSWNSGFPSSTTETHTKTTIVTPPSYATVNMPPPSITQAAPVVQQPVMMSAPCPPVYQAPVQSHSCQPYQSHNPCEPYRASNPCISPSQVGAYDPCAYQVSVPQQSPQKYTIAIPPAPATQYTIALPQGNPPQYAVVQQQTPVQSSVPVKLQSHDERCE